MDKGKLKQMLLAIVEFLEEEENHKDLEIEVEKPEDEEISEWEVYVND